MTRPFRLPKGPSAYDVSCSRCGAEPHQACRTIQRRGATPTYGFRGVDEPAEHVHRSRIDAWFLSRYQREPCPMCGALVSCRHEIGRAPNPSSGGSGDSPG